MYSCGVLTAVLVVLAGRPSSVGAGGERYKLDGDKLATVRWPTTREKIWAIPETVKRTMPTLSPDGRSIAVMTVYASDKCRMVLDGKPGPLYDQMGEMRFGPDSRNWGYPVLKKGKMRWNINGVDHKAYRSFPRPALVFNADGKHFAYTADYGDKMFVVHDGIEGKPYDSTYSPLISADGKHIAYQVWNDGEHFVVYDGVEGDRYDGIRNDSTTLSPDGKRWAYTAKVKNVFFAVVDGKEGPRRYAGITVPYFSADSKSVAYLGVLPDKTWVAVVNGVESEPYKKIEDFTFSRTGSSFAYCTTGKDDVVRIVHNGKKGRPLKEAYGGFSLVLSPDGKICACVDGSRFKARAWIDGEHGEFYTRVSWSRDVFSPDSKRLAYIGVRGDAEHVLVVDGKEVFAAPEIKNVRFSPNSKRIACLAMLGRKQYYVWADGVLGACIPKPVDKTFPVFVGPDTVEIMELSNRTYFRVQMSLSKPVKVSDDKWPEDETHVHNIGDAGGK